MKTTYCAPIHSFHVVVISVGIFALARLADMCSKLTGVSFGG